MDLYNVNISYHLDNDRSFVTKAATSSHAGKP
jgi:hypothetical protein